MASEERLLVAVIDGLEPALSATAEEESGNDQTWVGGMLEGKGCSFRLLAPANCLFPALQLQSEPN